MKHDLFIFNYDNYRFLLTDFYKIKKAKTSGRFSYRAFAKEAGFAASNYIQLIISEKKNISEAGIHGLAIAMGLTRRERDFFEVLVYFTQAATAQKKTFYFKRMCTFREFIAGQELIEDQYEYFSHWYYVAIRELVSLPGFDGNSKKIAKALGASITPSEAKEALDLLYRLGMIFRDKNKRWKLQDPHLKSSPEISSSMATQFHHEMITRALDGLRDPAPSREFNAITMAINSVQFEEIKTRCSQFWQEIQHYLADSAQEKRSVPDRICQLNLQLFHLIPSKGDRV